MNIQLPTAERTLEHLSSQIRRRLASNDSDLSTQVQDLRKSIKFALAVLWLNKPVWYESAFWVSSLKSLQSSLGQLRGQSVLLDCIQTLKYDDSIPDSVLSQLSIDQLRQKLVSNNETLFQSRIGRAHSELFAFVDELAVRLERDHQVGVVSSAWMAQRLNCAVTVVINAAEAGPVTVNGKTLHQYRQQVQRLYYLLKLCSLGIERRPAESLHEGIQSAKALVKTLGLHRDYSTLISQTRRFTEDVALYKVLQVAAKNRCLMLKAKLPLQQSSLVQALKRLTDAQIGVA